MKRSGIRRRKTAIFIAVIMTASVLITGCDKRGLSNNTENNKKNTNTVSNRDGIGGKLGIPDGCNEELDTGNSKLKSITINDADISVPDTDKMCIEYVTNTSIDNKEKKRVSEIIFDKDEGIYKYDDDHMSKSDYERELQYYKEQNELAKATNEKLGYESWAIPYSDEAIKEMEDKIAAAADDYEAAGDYDAYGFLGVFNGRKYTLNIVDYVAEDGADEADTYMYLRLYSDDRSGTLAFRPYEGAGNVYCADDASSMDFGHTNVTDMTEEEAENLAGKFYADLEMKDIVVQDIYNLLWYYRDEEYNDIATECDGYAVKYVRAVDGVPVYNLNFYRVDNLQFDNANIAIPYENYSAYVYDGEVIQAGWDEVFVTERIEENVELISYDEMLEKANIEIAKYYEKYPTNYSSIEFNDVRLTYYLVSDGEAGLRYIPVWVFLEYEEMQDYDAAREPTQIVIMNAMDGTVIDIVEEAKKMGCYMEY